MDELIVDRKLGIVLPAFFRDYCKRYGITLLEDAPETDTPMCLPNGEQGLIIDTGSIGNLGGDIWALQFDCLRLSQIR